MFPVAVMCSGSGTNLQALLEAEAAGELHAEIVLVVSNRKEAYALERARSSGKDAVHMAPNHFEREEDYAAALLALLRGYSVELICLAGHLKKLPVAVVRAYRGRIVNIHPALLPDFGGDGMYGHRVHEAVLASGRQESGPSVHFVDEEYDRGPIIAQTRVPVLKDDTADTLAERVLAAEHKLYPRVVAAIAQGKIRLENGVVVGSVGD
jgi:phosphoribosylglycinamide formyltransferase-1